MAFYNKSKPSSYTPRGNGTTGTVDVFFKDKQNPKMKVVYGDFYFTRVGKPITQLNTAEGLIDVDPYFTATMALSEKSADYLAGQGFNIQEANDTIPKPFIRFKRKVKDSTTEIKVFDKNGKPMDKSILIGNGSKGQALVFTYDHEDGTKGGALMGIQVETLVEYFPEGKDEEKPKAPPARPAASVARKPLRTNKQEQTVEEVIDDEMPF